MTDIDRYLSQFKNPEPSPITNSFNFIFDIFGAVGQIFDRSDKNNESASPDSWKD